MKKCFLLLAILFSAALVFAQSTPSADEVLKAAYQQAAKENKNVFLIFHASWCGWCRKMDSSIHDPSVHSFFENNYVIIHLDVLEREEKKSLENPGGEAFLNSHSGKDQGLPFWIILDKNGNVLGDSQMRPGVNTGCPASEEEVRHFVKTLEKTSKINEAEKIAVTSRFRRNDSR